MTTAWEESHQRWVGKANKWPQKSRTMPHDRSDCLGIDTHGEGDECPQHPAEPEERLVRQVFDASAGWVAAPAKHHLLIVAIRTDDEQIKRRMETILAAAATYENPPNTTPCVYAKPVAELTANDAHHLAHFVGWESFRALNVGDVVSDGS